MKVFGVRNVLVALVISFFVAIGGASAQNTSREYRQWQDAQREAQQRYMDYQRTGSQRDYRQWQRAQMRAQREYNDYQRTSRFGYNNGYYNNGNTVVYNSNNGRYYRVYRNGSYYQTDYRGAELLRQAVNSGYQQGYRQGVNDRRYGRGMSYYDDSIYRNGTYGYQSYVARDQYQYYFQQGFQRGYEDGYNNSMRYGYRSGSAFNILGSVLNTILNLTQQ
jgi:hypothetical protein